MACFWSGYVDLTLFLVSIWVFESDTHFSIQFNVSLNRYNRRTRNWTNEAPVTFKQEPWLLLLLVEKDDVFRFGIRKMGGIDKPLFRGCAFKCNFTSTLRLIGIGLPREVYLPGQEYWVGWSSAGLCHEQQKENGWRLLVPMPLPIPMDCVLLRRLCLGTSSPRVQLTQASASYK